MDTFHLGWRSGPRSLIYIAGEFADEEIVKNISWFKGRAKQKRLAHLFASNFPMAKLEAAEIDLELLFKPIRQVNDPYIFMMQGCAGRWPFSLYLARGEVGTAMIKKLAAYGIDFNVRQPRFKTVPLSAALNRPKIFEAMIECGADVSLLDVENLLENAREFDLPEETVAILRQYQEANR